MYPRCFGPFQADAQQGPGWRMIQLTAERVRTVGSLDAALLPPLVCRYRVEHGTTFFHRSNRRRSNRRRAIWPRSAFRSRVANFLEMCDAAFHYSVIDRCATSSLASGDIGQSLLNDPAPTSAPQVTGSMSTKGFTIRAGGLCPVCMRESRCSECARENRRSVRARQEILSDTAIRSARRRLQPGVRKNRTDDHGCANRTRLYVPIGGKQTDANRRKHSREVPHIRYVSTHLA